MTRLLLALSTLALSACGTPSRDDGGALLPPTGGGGQLPTQRTWSSCGIPTRFVVDSTSSDGGCAGAPQAASLVTLTTSTDRDGVLAFGADAIPVSLSDDCSFQGATCDALDGGEGHWRSATIAVETGGSALRVRFSREHYERHVNLCAQDGEATLLGAPACLLEGTWTFTSPPALTAGACDTTWSGPLRIGDGGISFGSTEFPAELDLSRCTGTGARGGNLDVWLFNGAPRSASVQVEVAGTTLTGRIDDALVGTTTIGDVSCDGGTFTFVATREPAPAEPRVAGCDVPRPPFVVGDGRCEPEAGETCFSSDCACAAPLSCRGAAVGCVLTCNTDEQCAATERCGVGRYCVPAGSATEGGGCDDDDDCVRALVCGRAGNVEGGVCATRCTNATQCSEQQSCRDGSCFTPIPIGGACTDISDCPAFNGARYCVGSGEGSVCTQPCQPACPAELPVCWVDRCAPQ